MELRDLERVQELKRQLEEADKTLRAFEAVSGPTVQARAYTDYNHRASSVELLPVDKHVAVDAARRERSKVVSELQQLGVQVS